jgi:hypothetical protein
MPKRVEPGERKDCKIGFRTTHAKGQRLQAIIDRILSSNKRVDKTEIYEELMNLKEKEFISSEDRKFLLGLRETLPERKEASRTRPTLMEARGSKNFGRGKPDY